MLVNAMNSHDHLEHEQNLQGEIFAWIPTELEFAVRFPAQWLM